MHFKLQISNCRFFVALLALIFCASVLRAADVEVSASLSQSSTEIGQPVMYQIKISGARSAQPPSAISVEGLGINYSGQSTQVQMNNFDVTMSVVHSYQVVPQRVGQFTIPPQIVEVSGKKYTANAVTLEVVKSASSSGSAQTGNSRQIFAEIVTPKQSAYVGEVIPVEVRFYVDSRIRWNTQQPPTLSGEGFTVQKFTNPQQNQVSKDGRAYDLVTFKTAVTAAKAGKLSLGPALLECVAQMPRPRRQRSGSPFDDFFNDDAFADAFGFGPAQQVTMKSEPVSIDVKSLPAQNQPRNFSGAVGQFTLSTSANPTRVKAGDPITITASITGRGNFDRVNAPQISNESGWRTYPPSAKFKADDDVGISGTKTFETAVIPDEPKTKTPRLQFSYFDPLAEKYVTLNGEQIAINVEKTNAPAPVVRAPATAQTSTAPTATPAPQPTDILYIRTDAARWGESFEPIYRTRGFWFAQIVPLAALATFSAVQISRSKQRDAAASRAAELRREKAELMKTLNRRDVSEAEFYDAAARYIRTDLALRTGRSAALIDVNDACNAVDSAAAEKLRSIFSAQAELRYAGFDSGANLTADKRSEVLDTIKRFENHHARA